MRPSQVAGIALIALLAACSPQVEATIPLSSLPVALAATRPAALPATLRVPEGSAESCAETLGARQSAVMTIMPVTAKGACVEIADQAYAEFQTLMPVILAGARVPADHLAVLEIEPAPAEAGQSYILSLRLIRTLDEVIEIVSAPSGSDTASLAPDLEDPKFILHLENDTPTPVGLTPWYVYVDGEPGMPGVDGGFAIAPGQSVELVLSDVVSSYLAGAQAARFASVTLAPAAL
ncbi:MAG: hypothetical protein WEB63_07630 [Cucumibacter sp.]